MVHDALTSVPIEAVHERAGDHYGRYLDPSEAAWELLAEALEDELREMKRLMGLGLVKAAEALCKGLVLGLQRAAVDRGNDALGWAADFPSEYAGEVVFNWVQAWPKKERKAAYDRMAEWLSKHVEHQPQRASRTTTQPHILKNLGYGLKYPRKDNILG